MISNKQKTAFYLSAAVFLALDRVLKLYVMHYLRSPWPILGDLLRLDFQGNRYIAFSLPLSGGALNLLVAGIIIFLIYYWIKLHFGGQYDESVAVWFAIFGSVSNLYDRFRYGFVIDYLDLKYFTVFNLADAMIVAAAGALLLLSFRQTVRPSQSQPKEIDQK